MPSTDRKLELRAKTSVLQTNSQLYVYVKGLKSTVYFKHVAEPVMSQQRSNCLQTSSISAEALQIHPHQIMVKLIIKGADVLICLPSLDYFYSAEGRLKTNQNNAMPEGGVVQPYHLLFNKFRLGYMLQNLNHKSYQVFKYVLNHSLSLAKLKSVTSLQCTECSGKKVTSHCINCSG
jgi:hypothetical protein